MLEIRGGLALERQFHCHIDQTNSMTLFLAAELFYKGLKEEIRVTVINKLTEQVHGNRSYICV